MSAQLSHLHKYTTVYRQIYPHATIILVRSHMSIFWTSFRTLKSRFNPVIEVLKALGCLENRQRMLTHLFSNGGAVHLVLLNRLLSSKSIPNSETIRPPSVLIIDSSPGGTTLYRIMLAATAPINNRLLKLLARSFVYFGLCVWWFVGTFLRRPNPIQIVMDALRNPRVLPWIDARTLRLYLYSRADEMVPWRDVEAHAARCASEGLDVRRVLFEKSGHAAHARVYPQEYWAAVRTVWEEACAGLK